MLLLPYSLVAPPLKMSTRLFFLLLTCKVCFGCSPRKPSEEDEREYIRQVENNTYFFKRFPMIIEELEENRAYWIDTLNNNGVEVPQKKYRVPQSGSPMTYNNNEYKQYNDYFCFLKAKLLENHIYFTKRVKQSEPVENENTARNDAIYFERFYTILDDLEESREKVISKLVWCGMRMLKEKSKLNKPIDKKVILHNENEFEMHDTHFYLLVKELVGNHVFFIRQLAACIYSLNYD